VIEIEQFSGGNIVFYGLAYGRISPTFEELWK